MNGRRSRIKAKGRRETGAFVPIPCTVLESENFKKLSAKGSKLLLDVLAQLRFRSGGTANNGDLAITMKIMERRGWNSRDSLYSARDELLHYGFLMITRVQRYISQCALYALTFYAIDECDDKLDVPSTAAPLNTWRQTRPKWRKPSRPKNKSLYRNSASVVPNNSTRSRHLPSLEVVR